MTENKRFTKCCPKIRDYDEEMSCTEVCDLLNKFYEENKELKSLCKVLITHMEKNSIAFVIDENIRRLLNGRE